MAPSFNPTYPLFPIFAFLGFVLSLIPLPWHIQAWNSGTCAFMVWTGMTCLIEFVNAVVWHGNVNNVSPIWCDISSKLILGVSIGIPAATLCISRRLYSITAMQTASVTREDKRKMVIGDLCIAVGIPILIMILHVVVQPHRFDILEDIGCYPAVYNTLPAYFLYYMWPALLGTISLVYSCLTLRSFWLRRAQFSQLISSNSSMNPSRYLRLMLLALIDITCTVPLSIFTIHISNKGVGMAPWISWEETHFNFGRVALVPAMFWRSDAAFQTSVELTRWLPVFCAFLFFGLFGFAFEARKQYSSAFWAIAQRFGFTRPSTESKASLPSWKKTSDSKLSAPQGSLPVYTPKPSTHKKHRRPNSLSSSLASSEVELDTYTEKDFDDSTGLPSPTSSTAPPGYSHPHSNDISSVEKGDFHTFSTHSSRTCFTSLSNPSLRTLGSHNHFSNAVYASPIPRSPTPSPA